MVADPRRATEGLADYLRRRAVELERFSSGERRVVLRALADIEREIRIRLEDYDPTGVRLTAARRRRLEAMLRDTNTRIAALMRNARDEFGETLAELAEIEASSMSAAMRSTFALTGIGDNVRLVPRNVIETLAGDALVQGAPIKDWWARQSAGLRERFSDAMRLGVAQGETLAQLIQRVRGTRAEGFRNGVMFTTRRQAETLVRSSVNSVSNDARLKVFQANRETIEAIAHLSTLDSRTTIQCASRDGLTWTVDGEPIGHGIQFQAPPIHWNCRSVLSPKVFGADEMPGYDRASADGPVPATMNFDQWLRTKSIAEQNEILGAGRAKLWRDNQLSMTQLVDFRGNPLSLSALRRRASASNSAARAASRAAPDRTDLSTSERILAATEDAKAWVREKGRELGVEHLVLIDNLTGEVLDRNVGLVDRVAPTPVGMKALLDRDRPVVAIHNHPSSSSFSGADILFDQRGGGHGIWAIGHDGSDFYARTIPGREITQRMYSIRRRRVERAMVDLFYAKKITFEDVRAFTGHLIWEHFRRRGLLDYRPSFNVTKQARLEELEDLFEDLV